MNKFSLFFAILSMIAISLAMVCTTKAALFHEAVCMNYANKFIIASLILFGISFLFKIGVQTGKSKKTKTKSLSKQRMI